MDDINRILNDESHNDKQLIKELSMYIKNHRDKKLPINKKFFIDITNIVLRNSELEFNEIIFNNDDNEYNWCATWSSDTLTCGYNITKILNAAICDKKYWFPSCGLRIDQRVADYYESLFFIIHEFTHARQDYVSKYFNNNIYDSCDNFIDSYYEEYSKHHNEVLIERYANLRGSIIAYKVLSYIYPLNYISPFRLLILSWLRVGYKINNQGNIELISLHTQVNKESTLISALDTYNSIMEENSCDKITIKSNNNLTFYDRLYLGLPITKEECNELQATLSKDFLKYVPSNNDQSDVKRLINRM